MNTEEKKCPHCGGTSGYEYVLTEDCYMNGQWGEPATGGDTGNYRYSHPKCSDCGKQFRMKALREKGLAK